MANEERGETTQVPRKEEGEVQVPIEDLKRVKKIVQILSKAKTDFPLIFLLTTFKSALALKDGVYCPLVRGRCRKDCNFYLPTRKDPDATVYEKLAHHYGNCWIKYYIMVSLRVGR